MSDGEGMYFWQLCVGIQAVSAQSSPASYSMHSQLINQTQERGQTVVTHSVQWVCQAINKSSSICVFSTPKNQHI